MLVAGGGGTGGILSSTELYDPATGRWTETGSLVTGRDAHTATLLPSGKVLVAGGLSYLSGAELYDPTTGTWTARYVHPRGIDGAMPSKNPGAGGRFLPSAPASASSWRSEGRRRLG